MRSPRKRIANPQKTTTPQQKIEGHRVFAVCYEGNRVDIEMDLDMYQMLDLHRDAKDKLRENGLEVPEYAGFMCSPPPIGCRRKLPLSSDADWLNLVNLWECAAGDIPIYMLSISSPSPYHLYEQELQNVQTNNGVNYNEKLADEENRASEDDMDSEVQQVGEEQFMGVVAKRKLKAKEWVDSLVITPQTQSTLNPPDQSTVNPHGQPIVSP